MVRESPVHCLEPSSRTLPFPPQGHCLGNCPLWVAMQDARNAHRHCDPLPHPSRTLPSPTKTSGCLPAQRLVSLFLTLWCSGLEIPMPSKLSQAPEGGSGSPLR